MTGGLLCGGADGGHWRGFSSMRATVIEELVDALKFSPALTGPDSRLNGTTADEVGMP